MKIISLILVVSLLQAIAYSQETIATYPSEAAASVSNLLSKVHNQIVEKVQSTIRTDVSIKDLQVLLKFLDAETNSLSHSHVEEKLDLAKKQLENARADASTILTDPESKAELSVEPDKWLSEIERQKSQESILTANIAHLRHVVDELLQWNKVLESVLPPPQISEKLRARLIQLLKEWENQDQHVGFGSSEAPLDKDVDAKPALNHLKETNLSRSTGGVLAGATGNNRLNVDSQSAQEPQEDVKNDSLDETQNFPKWATTIPTPSPTISHRSEYGLRLWTHSQKNSSVGLQVENRTAFRLYFKFSCWKYQHVWPSAPNSWYLAQPGQTVYVGLRGFAGEPLYLTGWSPDNPIAHWGNRSPQTEDQPPVAHCGDGNSVQIVIQ